MPINVNNIASILIPMLTGGQNNVAPSAPAQPGQPLPSDSVSIGQAPQAAKPEPQHKIDGPVQELPQPLEPKKWTVLVYSMADNNLYQFMQEDLNEAERIGGTPNLNLVAMTDHAQAGGGAKIYELAKDDQPQLHSPVRKDLGNYNMAQKGALSEFIQWGMKNYPAENTMVIISDHGAGWKGAGQDETSGGWMTNPMIKAELDDAFEKTGKKVDVLGFDACLMANAEAAYELRDSAKFIVGSEEVEGGAGWQYDETMNPASKGGETIGTVGSRRQNRLLSSALIESAETAMRSREGFGPKEMAAHIVEMAKGHQGDLGTMSAYDSEKLGKVGDAVKEFGKAILDSGVPLVEFKKAKRDAQGFYENKDLGSFATKVAAIPGAEQKLVEAAKKVQQSIEECMVAEQHSTKYPGATGMTIALNKSREADGTPVTTVAPNMADTKENRGGMGKYNDLQFQKDTDWAAVQDRLAQKVEGFAEEDTLLGGLTPEDLINIVGGLLGGLLAGHAKEAQPKA